MKTKFFYGLLLASAACLSVCSCNDNEPKAVTENPVDAFEELNANLQDYNAEFEMRHPQTRRNFFRKLVDFVKADFGGYWWLAHFSRFCHLQIIDIQQYYKTMYRDTNP